MWNRAFPVEWRKSRCSTHLYFQGQSFVIFHVLGISRKRWEMNNYWYCHQIWNHVFAMKWCYWKCCTSWPWPKFSRSQKLYKYINIQYLDDGESYSDNCSSMTFTEGWSSFSRSNIFLLCVCLKNCAGSGCLRLICPRLSRPQSWSCSWLDAEDQENAVIQNSVQFYAIQNSVK